MLRLPGTMKMEVSKVLCLRRKMQFIFGQRRQSIASATENDLQHVCRYVRMSRRATLACKTTLQPAVIPKETTRDMLELQNALSARHPQLFTLRSFKMDIFREVFSWTSKFATSQNATTEPRCHHYHGYVYNYHYHHYHHHDDDDYYYYYHHDYDDDYYYDYYCCCCYYYYYYHHHHQYYLHCYTYYAKLHYIIKLHLPTLHCTTLRTFFTSTTKTTFYITLQLQLHYTTTTTTTALHHSTSSSCGWGDYCNHCIHSKKHNSNYLSVHPWIRSAIRDSPQATAPIGSYFWNFCPLLARYHWEFIWKY